MSSPSFRLRGKQKLDLSKAVLNGPKDATVVVVPLPKDTVGVIFGQRTADYGQRYVTYILKDEGLIDEEAVWDAPTQTSRFHITNFLPQTWSIPDTDVLSVGPFSEDRSIAVYLSYKKPGKDDYQESTPTHSFKDFEIGGKTAISFTMINADDGGGDEDYHDTVVGVAVVYTQPTEGPGLCRNA